MNNSTITTPKKFIQTLKIIHLALIMGCVMFLIVSYLINENWILDFNIRLEVFSILPFIAVVGGVSLDSFIYKKILDSLEGKNTLYQKLNGYLTASIIKFALLEAPILLCLVVGLVTSNLSYSLLALLLIVYFVSIKPTKVKIEKDLNLKGELKSQFSQLDRDIV